MFKKIFFFGLSLTFLASCETKFSVNGEYEETPIVHFLLDQGQEFQFLKLNRTFLKEGNANEFAKDAELSYFDNVVATVEEIKNGSVQKTWTLEDTVINNKDEGAFYGPEQKLYFFRGDENVVNGQTVYLDEDAFYRLNIDIDNGNHIVEGQTELVKGVGIEYPNINISFGFAENNVPLNGYRTTQIKYSTSPEASIFKGRLEFDYREFVGSNSEVKTVLMELGESVNNSSTNGSATFLPSGERFYQLLQSKIAVDPNVTKRQVEGMKIVITAGSRDLYTYMLTNEPSSSLAQNKPTYSNVDGALGIFSSRVTATQYKPSFNGNWRALNQNSTKELCNGQYTNALNFCSPIPNDINTTYYCN
ncbi:DUF4249 family protein [Brumimicrobium mesophilum]|uniref:DUF4249 family protein n=1 Tax=Brumimicrobium mesophilum TaxID=392717 RepID=UPI000D142BAF|nr:DUF4249 family protein [Brumimicrobium mesophilum]